MENITIKEKNMEENLEDKKQPMELILGKSLSIFKLGSNISNYLFLKHIFYPKNKNIIYDYDVYEFINIDIDLYVYAEKAVDTITTRSSCVYMEKELINMYYDDFLELSKFSSTNNIRVYSEGPHRNGRYYDVYYFDQGIILWVWRNKIRTIQIGYIYEEDGEHIKL